MNPLSILLTDTEKELIQDAAVIHAKNRILAKVAGLLGQLSVSLKEVYDVDANPYRDICSNGAKLSKGEQYEGLPYFMLDYPRGFGKDDCLAVRTFFWWGNYFSVTLHLKGSYLHALKENLMVHADRLRDAGFRLSLGGDEWMHDLNGEHWQDIPQSDALQAALDQCEYCKLSRSVPLWQWEEMPELLRQHHEWIGELLIN